MPSTSTSTPAKARAGAKATTLRFTVDRAELEAALTFLAKAVPTRPALPVLRGVLLSRGGSDVALATFDFEECRTVVLPTVGPRGTRQGRALVDCALLTRMVKQFPKPKAARLGRQLRAGKVLVQIEVSGAEATVQCGTARLSLPTMPVEDYPDLPGPFDALGSLDAATFGQAFAKVATVAGGANGVPILRHVHLAASGKRLTLTATDRYRVAQQLTDWQPKRGGRPFAALLPAKDLSDAAKKFASLGGQVVIGQQQGGGDEPIVQVLAAFGRYGVSVRQREAATNYPDMGTTRPDNLRRKAVVDARQLAEVAGRVAVVLERTSPLRLHFEGDTLTVSAGTPGTDAPTGEEPMPCTYSGTPLTVCVLPKVLLDALAQVGTRHVRLEFADGVTAFAVYPLDERKKTVPGYLHWCMPVRSTDSTRDAAAEEAVEAPGAEPGADAARWSAEPAPDSCEHQTGEPGCPLMTCWGIPDMAGITRSMVRVKAEPDPGEPGLHETARALATATWAATGTEAGDVICSDTGWDHRPGVRMANMIRFYAGPHAVSLVLYESRNALRADKVSYGALYVGDAPTTGQPSRDLLIDGALRMNRGAARLAAEVALLVSRSTGLYPAPAVAEPVRVRPATLPELLAQTPAA